MEYFFLSREQIISLLILILLITVLALYYRAKSFIRPHGVTLLFLALVALWLRVFEISTPIKWYNSDNIFLTAALIFIPGILFFVYSYKKLYLNNARKLYFYKLLPLYIFFGALQQVFFLIVFSDSVLTLTNNKIISYISGVIFFFIFHLNWGRYKINKFLPLLFLFGLFSVYAYLFLENVFPQLLIHGFVGAILFSGYVNNNQINMRLKQ